MNNQGFKTYVTNFNGWALGLVFALVVAGLTPVFGQSADQDSVKAWKLKAIEVFETDPAEAFNILDESLALAQRIGDDRGAYAIHEAWGYLKVRDDELEEALEAYQKSISLATEMDSLQLVGYGVQHVGSTYLRLGRLEKAKEKCLEALEIFIELENPYEQAVAIGTLGTIEMELKNHDLAEEKMTRAGTIYDSIGFVRGRAFVNSNLAHLNLIQGKGKEALPFIEQTLEFNSEQQDIRGIAMANGNMGKALSLLGDSAKAFSHYSLCLVAAKANGWERIEYDTYKDISDTYSAYGDHEKALVYLSKYHALRDSVVGSETQGKIAELEVQFETAQKERQIESLEQLQQISQLKLWRMAIATGFGMILTVLIILTLRARAKKNRALHLAEQELAQTQIREKELEKQKVEEELDYKSRHLTEFALDIQQKSDLSKDIKERLDAIEFTQITRENRDKINELRTLITSHLQTGSDLDLFQQRVDEANMQFNINLKKRFPALTENDLVLCGLLRLNLQNKEIASIRNVSDDAVKMARYRLRKKLDLSEDQDIAEFLRSV